MSTPSLHQLLKAMLDKRASDLHITTGSPPQLRIDGDLVPLRTDAMTPVDTKQLCYSILTDAQKLRFEEDSELDLSFGVKRVHETIGAALTIAETGHLAFGTLHTNSAIQTINRIVDVFPPHQQAQIRTVLSFVLEGVITQTLIPLASGSGRAMACEVM